jgi:hypothetical protein
MFFNNIMGTLQVQKIARLRGEVDMYFMTP